MSTWGAQQVDGLVFGGMVELVEYIAGKDKVGDHAKSGMGHIYKARVGGEGGDIVVVKLTPQGDAMAAREWMGPIFEMRHPNICRMYSHQPYPHGGEPMECIMM